MSEFAKAPDPAPAQSRPKRSKSSLDSGKGKDYYFDNHRNIEMFDRTSLARMFSALGNPHRLAIFERLCRAETERCRDNDPNMCVCEVAAGMGLSMSTISHHLKELRQVGLVTCRKRGQKVYCTVNQEALGLIQGFAGNALAMCRQQEQRAVA